jgi:hypothetical protein
MRRKPTGRRVRKRNRHDDGEGSGFPLLELPHLPLTLVCRSVCDKRAFRSVCHHLRETVDGEAVDGICCFGVPTAHQLARFQRLRTMLLDGLEGGESLVHLSTLHTLTLRASSGASPARWTLPPSITSLDASWASVNSASALAPALPALQTLLMQRCSLYEIQSLAAATALQRLDISYTYVQDVSALSGLQRLRHLNISGTQVLDISPLPTTLATLLMQEVCAADLGRLAACTGLEVLSTRNQEYAGRARALPLAGLTALRELGVTGHAPQALATTIERLSLHACPDLPDLSGLVALRALDLSACRPVTAEYLRGLAQLPALRALRLVKCDVPCLATLLPPQLQALTLVCCANTARLGGLPQLTEPAHITDELPPFWSADDWWAHASVQSSSVRTL